MEALSRFWWVFGLRGVVAILFGVAALLMPGITLLSLTALFSAFALVGGVVSIYGALKNRSGEDHWWIALLWGIVSIGAGLLAALRPGLSALIFVLVIGANAIVNGVLDIVAAIRMRKTISGEWMMVLNGVVEMAFGAIVFAFPGAGALALVWLIGAYAIVSGVLLLAVAARVRTRHSAAHGERRVTPDRRGIHAPA